MLIMNLLNMKRKHKMRELTIGLSIVAIGGVLGVLFNSLIIGVGFVAAVGGLSAFVGALNA